MEGVILVLLLVLGVPIALFIWFGTKASRADRGVRELEVRFASLQYQLDALRNELRNREQVAAAPPPKPISIPVARVAPAIPTPPPIREPVPEAVPTHAEEEPERVGRSPSSIRLVQPAPSSWDEWNAV